MYLTLLEMNWLYKFVFKFFPKLLDLFSNNISSTFIWVRLLLNEELYFIRFSSVKIVTRSEGIAAVCSIRVATKIIDWCVSWGQLVYILSTILTTRNQQDWSYTDAHCVNVAVKVTVNCCFSGSTCIHQLAPGSGCGGGSGSGAGITDDDTSGMPNRFL